VDGALVGVGWLTVAKKKPKKKKLLYNWISYMNQGDRKKGLGRGMSCKKNRKKAIIMAK
jgi:hypothetical protein